MNEFAHSGAKRGHFGFASGHKSIIDRFDMRVVFGRYNSRHVQYGPDSGWTGFRESGSPQNGRSGLLFNRNQAQIGGKLSPIETMALDDCQQIGSSLPADGGNTGQKFHVAAQIGMAINMVVDILLQLGKLFGAKSRWSHRSIAG